MLDENNSINIMDYADADLDELEEEKDNKKKFLNPFKHGASAWVKDKLVTFVNPDELSDKVVKVKDEGTSIVKKGVKRIKSFFSKLADYIDKFIYGDDDIYGYDDDPSITQTDVPTVDEPDVPVEPVEEEIDDNEINEVVNQIIKAEPKKEYKKPEITVEPEESVEEVVPDTAYTLSDVYKTEDMQKEGYNNNEIAEHLNLVGNALDEFKRREAIREKNRAHYQELKDKYNSVAEGYASKINDEIETKNAENDEYDRLIQTFMDDLKSINPNAEGENKTR